MFNQLLINSFSREEIIEILDPINENFFILREIARIEFGIET
jgi:hypothetical protein